MENETEGKKGFFKDFDIESFLLANRYPLITLLAGLILIGFGAFYIKSRGGGSGTKVEDLSGTT